MALLRVLGVALAASFPVDRLRKEGQIEHCLLAGHANCDALVNEEMSS